MPLDNAQFISELSITDPLGTDLLNQGDDQIRTTKRATQQSFPNVNAAVPQTAAQMGQMAIKNEANIFTLENRFRSSILLRDASVSNPAWAFENEIGTGFFRSAGGVMAATTVGAVRMFISSSAIQCESALRSIDGTELLPGMTFTNNTGNGFFLNVNGVSCSVNGAQTWAMSTNGMFAGAGFQISADGGLITATKPGFAFGNDSDTGLYRAAANSCTIAAGGTGALNFDFPTNAIWAGAGYVIRGTTENDPTRPAFSFTNDTNTGFYRIQADVSGLACGGVQVMSFGTGGIGIRLGTPFFPNLPTSPGFGGSLWNDTTDGNRVKVA